MTVSSALLLFLLLPALSRSLDGSPSSTELAPQEEIPTTTVDPCICPDEIFDESEMDGYIKHLEGCQKEYSCNFIVEPKKDMVLSISVQEQTSQAKVHLYYYKGSRDKKDMIYVTDIARSDNIIKVPEGYGIFVTLNGTTEKTYWYGGGDFQAKFERYNKSEVSNGCPQPVLVVNSTVQSIETSEWSRAGCAFRLSSSNAIHVRANCGDSWMRGIRVSVNFANQTQLYKSETVEGQKELDWYLPPSDIDLYVRDSSYYYSGGCTVNYFSLDYNPCNCSDTDFNLTLDTPITLSSPGYPRLLCNNLKCHYNLTIAKPAAVGQKTAFVVSALHQSRAAGDKLVFNIDKKSSVSLADYNSNVTESAVYVGNLLEIDYTASSLLSNDHGFVANITAVHIPNDCLCPSSLKKELDGSSFSMDIKPHCRIMNCKFTIPNNSSYVNRTFRLELDHYLPQDGESLDVIAGEVLHEHYHDDEYKATNKTKRSAVDYVTSTGITIQYRRFMTNNVSSDDSRFNMTWKWMTSSDCKCALIHDWAEPEARTLYSPGYPQRYCSSMNCTYHLEAHEGSNIEMNVTFFETEPHRDFLTFFDGAPGATNIKLKQLNGFVKKSPVIQAGSNATLVFTSDSNVNNKGFVIKYRSVPAPVPKTSSVGSHWIVIVSLVVVFVAAVTAAGVVVYKKRTAEKPFESIANPIYGFSNVHDVLVIPSDE